MAQLRWADKALEELFIYLSHIEASGGDTVSISRRVDKATLRLERFPESAPLYEESFRRLEIRDLSVSCYYSVEEDIVTILHFRHDHQQPLDALSSPQ